MHNACRTGLAPRCRVAHALNGTEASSTSSGRAPRFAFFEGLFLGDHGGFRPADVAADTASPQDLVSAALRADPAVEARLGEPSGRAEFRAVLLSQGGELPHGMTTPLYFDTDLVVARLPAYTPHGFYQTKAFVQVYLQDGAVTSVRLVGLAIS